MMKVIYGLWFMVIYIHFTFSVGKNEHLIFTLRGALWPPQERKY